MRISLPNGKEQLMEQTSKTTSRYNFGRVAIEIPEEAQKILSTGGPTGTSARNGVPDHSR
jgi:hypothetical protein